MTAKRRNTQKQKSSSKERRERLRKRTEENYNKRDQGGISGKRVLNLSEYEDVNFWQPKKGYNEIDIIPFIISSDNHPAVKAGEYEIGEEDYLLDIWVHRFIGPSESAFVCLKRTYGQPCPICEELKELQHDPEANEDLIKSLRPTRRCFYNVIDLNDEDAGIQIFEVSHFLFEKELLEEAAIAEEEIVVFSDLEEGRTIKCRATQKKLGRSEYFEFKSFSFEERDPYPEEIMEDAYPFDAMLNIATYDEILKIYQGVDEPEEDDDEEEEKPRQSKKASSRKKQTKEDEPEEDDEEEAPKQKKASSKKKKENNDCPSGHTFGDDCDKFKDDCDECDAWEECADANEN